MSSGERTERRLPFAPIAIVLALLVAFAWFGRGRFTPVLPGAPAPEFVRGSVTDADGRVVTLGEYSDGVTLVSIWATWCGPCREEMPSMQRMYEALEGEKFEILAVSIDPASGSFDFLGNRGADPWAYADSLGITFPILHDPSGVIQKTYQTTGVPETFVIDRRGTIIRKVIGSTRWDDPRTLEMIRRLLEG